MPHPTCGLLSHPVHVAQVPHPSPFLRRLNVTIPSLIHMLCWYVRVCVYPERDDHLQRRLDGPSSPLRGLQPRGRRRLQDCSRRVRPGQPSCTREEQGLGKSGGSGGVVGAGGRGWRQLSWRSLARGCCCRCPRRRSCQDLMWRISVIAMLTRKGPTVEAREDCSRKEIWRFLVLCCASKEAAGAASHHCLVSPSNQCGGARVIPFSVANTAA